jgi:hypothetical protein
MASVVCTSFKTELLTGGTTNHVAGAAGDDFKIALYTSVLPASTTVYSGTGEVTHANYVAGGKTLGKATVSNISGTAVWDFVGGGGSDISAGAVAWTNVTFPAQSALVYNSTKSGKAVAVLDFGGTITATAGTFTVTLPASGAATSIVRIA